MDEVLLMARLLLAVTFGVAGVVKLRDTLGFANGLQDLGIPRFLHGPVSAGLPGLELGVALALLWPTTAWFASVVALLLLLAFTGVIARQLLQGRRPACNCLGQASAAPISAWTLVRNLALMASALVLVGAGNRTASGSITDSFSQLPGDDKMLILLLVVVSGLAGWMIFRLMEQQGRLMLRIDNLELRLGQRSEPGTVPIGSGAPQGLVPGTPAPEFQARLLGSGEGSLQGLLREGRPVILVFSDPECGPCQALAPQLLQWEREMSGQLTMALVSRGDPQLNRKKFGTESLQHVFLQNEREIANAYKVFATPSAVRINAAGQIDSYLAMADMAIDSLVHEPLSAVQDDQASPALAAIAALGERPSPA